ncbi:hypothetical protein EYF80_015235 [Liparis tanakae]|uniref:Uncharacterized protein n=1 Tax=Liparis tanakae TaxID=230148 RepID=A0A4Z2IAM0_9TELE|nr:hypothetical protein EYF80_015235 [Liparis tanakae]
MQGSGHKHVGLLLSSSAWYFKEKPNNLVHLNGSRRGGETVVTVIRLHATTQMDLVSPEDINSLR